MKKLISFFILLAVWLLTNRGYSQYTQPEDLMVIAKNWIQIITDRYGSWGGNEAAYPGQFEEFRHKGKLIGYYCDVQPIGFMVFSLRRELAPVKAYSDMNSIDPSDEEGIVLIIKKCMSRIVNIIESNYGDIETVKLADIDLILEADYRTAWIYIENYTGGIELIEPDTRGNYQQGQKLLTSNWHQNPPYNNACPNMSCDNDNGRAVVGCVATAGAQIMRHWNWPPYGVGSPYNDPFDWINMMNFVNTSSPMVQQDAVAEICYEVGFAAGTVYGCEGSGSLHNPNMMNAYTNQFRYNQSLIFLVRAIFNASVWFDVIKNNINLNRPIHYGIDFESGGRHSIVCDGWRETGVPIVKEYHINYGWGGSNTTWYTLDQITSEYLHDEMIIGIVPESAIGSEMLGTYTANPNFPYRYFDQDATGTSATFNPGQFLQTLHDIRISGSGTGIMYVKFYGNTGSGSTRIFTRGDVSRGIEIGKSGSGGLRLSNNGGIKLH